MPNTARLGGILIYQYYNDHHPPHFHAIQGEEEALIRIADLEIEKGALNSSALSTVRKWARDHRAELALNWVDALAGLQLQWIPYP